MEESSSRTRFRLPGLFGIVDGMGYTAACLETLGCGQLTNFLNEELE